jgi:hypothetical protein
MAKVKDEKKGEKGKEKSKPIEDDKCLRCGGKLVVSRRTLLKARTVWWQKPWGSSIYMDEPVVSWACMSCGSVFYFLRNKSKVLREYDELEKDEKTRIEIE